MPLANCIERKVVMSVVIAPDLYENNLLPNFFKIKILKFMFSL